MESCSICGNPTDAEDSMEDDCRAICGDCLGEFRDEKLLFQCSCGYHKFFPNNDEGVVVLAMEMCGGCDNFNLDDEQTMINSVCRMHEDGNVEFFTSKCSQCKRQPAVIAQ
ncbi:MAG: hypothetical protein OEV93_03675 [Candidatus Moranbacteria bacterium]|nr:hypothetical protein [Candidatus Moranbacteria bacterium]